MKKNLLVLFLLLVLLVGGGLFWIAHSFNAENYRKQLIKDLSEMTEGEQRKEFERLGIDFSWKSSQIEGNTYSLLETERLLRESKTADGKSKVEAVMLLTISMHCVLSLIIPINLKN